MLSYEEIDIFLSVAQYKNITIAAERIHISQSTASCRLKELERVLDCKLFIRQRGKGTVLLTQEGTKFLPIAERLMMEYKQSFRLNSEQKLDCIRIGSTDSMNRFLLNNIYDELVDSYPQLAFNFSTNHTWEIYEHIRNRNIDIGFAFNQAYIDFVAEPLFREHFYFVTRKKLETQDGLIYPDQLQKQNEVVFFWNQDVANWHDQWWHRSISPYVQVDSFSLTARFLERENSWSICPESAAVELQRQGMTVYSIGVPSPYRICYMIYRKSDTRNENITGVCRHIKQMAATSPWCITEHLSNEALYPPGGKGTVT